SFETRNSPGRIWNNGTPKALPPDVFLICGDRAWQGIPDNVIGGPCYLGKLTLLAPSMRDVVNIMEEIKPRRKRGIGLAPNCNDEVDLLSTTSRVFLSLFVPRAVAGNALRTVARLACWSEKQANLTTQVLEEMLLDQNSLGHALLQNRAAIDFLLLAQGHGCQDFAGMCCMNLSDHTYSIHKSLTLLKQHVSKIQQQQGLLDGWFEKLFGGLPGWLTGLMKEGLRLLFYIIILVLIGSCVLS
ncbi:ENV1 protein, partial [Nothocercus julius]|nr:ENV1 protein [Nothocercus julius]